MFKLSKHNYREIEYIINREIKYILLLNKDNPNIHTVQITITSPQASSCFKNIERVEIMEWNDGLRLSLFDEYDEHNYTYLENIDEYAELQLGGGAGNGLYSHSDIKLYSRNR